MNLLFVCSANISRSFLAERLMKHEIEKRRIPYVNVQSAGIYANPGFPADSKMVEYLKAQDIPVPEHESRRIQEEDIRWADHILVMEKVHAKDIITLWPEAENKVNQFGRYVSGDQSADDVVDPYGRSPYHYRLAQAQISLGIINFIETRLKGLQI